MPVARSSPWTHISPNYALRTAPCGQVIFGWLTRVLLITSRQYSDVAKVVQKIRKQEGLTITTKSSFSATFHSLL
jgi:hypothetical protein